MLNDFALIVSEETVHGLSDGRIDGRVAVAVVSNGVAEIHVVPLSDAAPLVGSLPRIPAPDGQDAFLLDHEEELELLGAVEEYVRNEVARKSFGPPPGFVQIESAMHHGLSVMVTEDGLDLRVGRKLADKARWKAGDRIGASVSSDGRTMCVFLAETGRELVPSHLELGALEASSYLPVPHGYAERLASTWAECSYWVSDGRIFFDVGQFEVVPEDADPLPMEDEDEKPVVPRSERLASLLDGHLVQGAVYSAMVVLLGALAWRTGIGW